jgi:hypothetical protein
VARKQLKDKEVVCFLRAHLQASKYKLQHLHWSAWHAPDPESMHHAHAGFAEHEVQLEYLSQPAGDQETPKHRAIVQNTYMGHLLVPLLVFSSKILLMSGKAAISLCVIFVL